MADDDDSILRSWGGVSTFERQWRLDERCGVNPSTTETRVRNAVLDEVLRNSSSGNNSNDDENDEDRENNRRRNGLVSLGCFSLVIITIW